MKETKVKYVVDKKRTAPAYPKISKNQNDLKIPLKSYKYANYITRNFKIHF